MESLVAHGVSLERLVTPASIKRVGKYIIGRSKRVQGAVASGSGLRRQLHHTPRQITDLRSVLINLLGAGVTKGALLEHLLRTKTVESAFGLPT